MLFILISFNIEFSKRDMSHVTCVLKFCLDISENSDLTHIAQPVEWASWYNSADFENILWSTYDLHRLKTTKSTVIFILLALWK